MKRVRTHYYTASLGWNTEEIKSAEIDDTRDRKVNGGMLRFDQLQFVTVGRMTSQ